MQQPKPGSQSAGGDRKIKKKSHKLRHMHLPKNIGFRMSKSGKFVRIMRGSEEKSLKATVLHASTARCPLLCRGREHANPRAHRAGGGKNCLGPGEKIIPRRGARRWMEAKRSVSVLDLGIKLF